MAEGPTTNPRCGLSAAGAAAAVAVVLAGCVAPRYEPCPVELQAPLPADAFERCRALVTSRFGALAEQVPDAFRLQTAWVAGEDAPLERRASVFREDHGVFVVVEVRWLEQPWFGMPRWTEVRADAATERELAEALAAELGR